MDLPTEECVKSSCPVGQFLLGAGNCVDCPTESNPLVSMQSDLDDNSCTVCDGGRVWAGHGYGCYYCPKPRVVCGGQCCAEGQACQVSGNSRPYTYTCVTAQCQRDADCAEPTPLCDTFTGTCFAGCHDNSDCGSNQYCLLDTTSTGGSCTQKPERGTCQPLTTQQVGEYTASTASMDWWSANNFCEALNMSLANLTIKCTSEEWAAIEESSGYACSALTAIFQGTSVEAWTRETRGNCTAFGISGYDGSINRSQKEEWRYALCE